MRRSSWRPGCARSPRTSSSSLDLEPLLGLFPATSRTRVGTGLETSPSSRRSRSASDSSRGSCHAVAQPVSGTVACSPSQPGPWSSLRSARSCRSRGSGCSRAPCRGDGRGPIGCCSSAAWGARAVPAAAVAVAIAGALLSWPPTRCANHARRAPPRRSGDGRLPRGRRDRRSDPRDGLRHDPGVLPRSRGSRRESAALSDEPRRRTFVVVNVLGEQTIDQLARTAAEPTQELREAEAAHQLRSALVYLVERPA